MSPKPPDINYTLHVSTSKLNDFSYENSSNQQVSKTEVTSNEMLGIPIKFVICPLESGKPVQVWGCLGSPINHE